MLYWSHCWQHENNLAEDIMELFKAGSLSEYKDFRWENFYLCEKWYTTQFLYSLWESQCICFWCNPYKARFYKVHFWSLANKHNPVTNNLFRVAQMFYLHFQNVEEIRINSPLKHFLKSSFLSHPILSQTPDAVEHFVSQFTSNLLNPAWCWSSLPPHFPKLYSIGQFFLFWNVEEVKLG